MNKKMWCGLVWLMVLGGCQATAGGVSGTWTGSCASDPDEADDEGIQWDVLLDMGVDGFEAYAVYAIADPGEELEPGAILSGLWVDPVLDMSGGLASVNMIKEAGTLSGTMHFSMLPTLDCELTRR